MEKIFLLFIYIGLTFGIFSFLFFVGVWSDYLIRRVFGWSWIEALEKRYEVPPVDEHQTMTDTVVFPPATTYSYACTLCHCVYPIKRNQEILRCPNCGDIES